MSLEDIRALAILREALETVMVEEGDRLSGEGLSRLAQAVTIARELIARDIVLESR